MRYTPRPDCQIPTLAEIYEKYLPEGSRRFVEVGAHDGVRVSNTVFLAEAGWHGVYIEPLPEAAALCRVNHAKNNVVVVNEGVSDHAGTADLYIIGDCSTLIWDKSAMDWGGSLDRKVSVQLDTLDHILDGLGWQPGFELLVIDVEQAEMQVLGGFTIGRWQPYMVIVETHELDTAPERNWKGPVISAWFAERGYAKIYTDHINSIFLRASIVGT